MALREFVFQTTHPNNLLCRWTRTHPDAWILIHLLRAGARQPARAAVFTIRAPAPEPARFLRDEFGRRYGTYEVLHESDTIASVEVSNYLLPTYRGQDPVELATRMLGPDAYVAPILVHQGYIHVSVIANPPAAGRNFQDLLSRVSAATNPEEFRLIHTGAWDPLQRLRPAQAGLTARQEETVRLATEFGYYDTPRRCTLSDVAKAAGVSKAAVHKVLIAAESKIIKQHVR